MIRSPWSLRFVSSGGKLACGLLALGNGGEDVFANAGGEGRGGGGGVGRAARCSANEAGPVRRRRRRRGRKRRWETSELGKKKTRRRVFFFFLISDCLLIICSLAHNRFLVHKIFRPF